MKMTKRLMSIFLTIALLLCLSVPTLAVEGDAKAYADALNHLGLFLGTDKGYELEENLTREQAITMIVRLLGAEEEALKANYGHPFRDVSGWANAYVGYAYEKGITLGVSANRFGALEEVTEEQFLTFLLRLLNYKDDEDFTWDDPYDLARKTGLVKASEKPEDECLRGDAVIMSWRFLNLKPKDGGMTIAKKLMGQSVFTAEEFAAAKAIVAGQYSPETEQKGDEPTKPSGGGSNSGSGSGSDNDNTGGESGSDNDNTGGESGSDNDNTGGGSGSDNDNTGGESGSDNENSGDNREENETEGVPL